jgi:hypothetical protein
VDSEAQFDHNLDSIFPELNEEVHYDKSYFDAKIPKTNRSYGRINDSTEFVAYQSIESDRDVSARVAIVDNDQWS